MSNRQPRSMRTIVVGTNWLGDAVMSLPAIAALREAFPGDVIDVCAPRPLVPLIEMASPVDAVWGWSATDSTRAKISRIRKRRYDRAVLFPNSFRAAWIARRSGILQRWGYAVQMRGWLLSHPVPIPRPSGTLHQSERYLTLIKYLGWSGASPPAVTIHIPEEVDRRAERMLGGGAGQALYVGLCAGAAYGPAKRWAPGRFAEVARALADGYGARILLTGSGREAPLIRDLADRIGRASLDLSGRTDLAELSALFRRCRLVISNDTGPMHLAAALGTPVVGVFTSTDPDATGPMGPHRTVRANVACTPCMKRSCPERTYRCIDSIETEAVLSAARGLLEQKGPVSNARG